MMTSKTNPKIQIPQYVITKAPGLLPMEYTISELASDLGIPDSTLRGWLKAGAPYSRDANQHIWIDGLAFNKWLFHIRKAKQKERLANDQAFCMHCQQPVQLLNPGTRKIQGKLINIYGNCPICGCRINRGGRLD